MNLVKLHPNHRTIDPWVNSVFDTVFREPIFDASNSKKVPAVNISETETGHLIEIAAPGLKKEDFNISLDKDILSISAEKQTEKTEEQKNFSKREFNFNSFSRRFNIPESVNVDDIKANYENGILGINLTKKEESVKQRTIEVK